MKVMADPEEPCCGCEEKEADRLPPEADTPASFYCKLSHPTLHGVTIIPTGGQAGGYTPCIHHLKGSQLRDQGRDGEDDIVPAWADVAGWLILEEYLHRCLNDLHSRQPTLPAR